MPMPILVSTDRAGTTFSRGPSGKNRVFLGECPGWESLTTEDRNAICSLVWASSSGSFEIVDAVTGEKVGEHTILEE